MNIVSIILPTYNGARWIQKSIESVQRQTYQNWELIVVSDGSKDDTENILLDMCQKDSRIIFLANENNLGIQKTLNRGIKEAKGDYVARIDDDDVWIDIHKLEKQVNFLNTNPECVVVGTGVVVVNESGVEMFRYLNPSTDRDIRLSILRRNPFIHSSVLFRKKHKGLGVLYSESEDFRAIEDYELWLRLGELGTLHNISDYSVAFMSRNGSITQKNRYVQFKKIIHLIQQYKKRYPRYRISLIVAWARLYSLSVFRMLPKKVQVLIFSVYKKY